MLKVVFLCAVLTFYALCETIKFKEEKYINAFQTILYKEGTILINNHTLELHYPKEKKSFIFNKENIIERKGEKEHQLSYEKSLELALFAKIIQGIYQNNTDSLEEFFNIKKENEKITLIPNEYIANAITKIEYKKEHSQLEFLKIYFTNEDWINISESK